MKEEPARARSPSPGSGGAAEPASLGLSVRPLQPDEKQQADTEGSLVVEEVERSGRAMPASSPATSSWA